MMAGIIGSARLEKPGENVWEKEECMREYKANLMQNGKYNFKMKVGHYCTSGKEYEELEFDLDFDPKDVKKNEMKKYY